MTTRGATLGAQDAPAPERGDAQRAPALAEVVPFGFFAVMRAIRKARTLTSTERLVLLLIAGAVDARKGTAAIGVPTLAEDSDFTERTIERTIATLLEPRPGFEPAAWLWKADELSEYGTNLYRVTPIAGDVRPPREHKRRPPTQGRGSTNDPRHSVGGAVATPDPGSRPPPIEDRGPPRSSIGQSPSSSAGSSTRTERGESPPPLDLEGSKKEKIMGLLNGHASLRAIAVPAVVNAIAEEGRPLDIVAAALLELASDAASAAGVSQPMSARELAKKARTYVRDQRAPAASDGRGKAEAPELEPEPPPEPPRLEETREQLAALVASIGTPPAGPVSRPTRSTPKAPAWDPPVRRR